MANPFEELEALVDSLEARIAALEAAPAATLEFTDGTTVTIPSGDPAHTLVADVPAGRVAVSGSISDAAVNMDYEVVMETQYVARVTNTLLHDPVTVTPRVWHVAAP
jgi:hypothetical protein